MFSYYYNSVERRKHKKQLFGITEAAYEENHGAG